MVPHPIVAQAASQRNVGHKKDVGQGCQDNGKYEQVFGGGDTPQGLRMQKKRLL